MNASASCPSLNYVCTSSTTIAQSDVSVDVDSINLPPLLLSVVSFPVAASYFSFFLAAARHPFWCSACIPEVPLEW